MIMMIMMMFALQRFWTLRTTHAVPSSGRKVARHVSSGARQTEAISTTGWPFSAREATDPISKATD
jgi:hypothetical protein